MRLSGLNLEKPQIDESWDEKKTVFFLFRPVTWISSLQVTDSEEMLEGGESGKPSAPSPRHKARWGSRCNLSLQLDSTSQFVQERVLEMRK